MKYSLRKKLKITYIRTAILAAIVAAFFLPSLSFFGETGDNLFEVYINGTLVGETANKQTAKQCLLDARKEVAKTTDGMAFMDVEMTFEGQEVLFGEVMPKKELKKGIENALRNQLLVRENMVHAYTVKIKNFTVNLASVEQVKRLLQAAIDKYDQTKQYRVELVQDTSRDLNVLTTNVFSLSKAVKLASEERAQANSAAALPKAGIFAAFEESMKNITIPDEKKDLSAYETGLIDMNFGDAVEVVESYMPRQCLSDLDKAIEEVTKDQATEQIYEVVAGDTLGEIAEDHNMSMEDLVAMNATLENENSTIRIGDELIISVPEPELSVLRQEQQYYEEDYDADIQYVDNDEWYTNQTQTLQQPSAGHRKVVALLSYRNDSVMNTDILKEDVDIAAVPKIVERGTKIPPTYIRPISGGRLSSGFGGRKAPKKGASTYHKGLDYATPVGTAVVASCGGVVTKAGWGSGYGYVVYIQHPDGRETRYGHLSKVLCSPGQSVSQGTKIALSGNTGNSTGPHLHFEIRINGTAVNPVEYLN